MVSTVVSLATASDPVIGAAVAGCIILLVSAELADDERPILKRLSRHLTIFSVPLLVLFGFIVIVWAARIISD